MSGNVMCIEIFMSLPIHDKQVSGTRRVADLGGGHEVHIFMRPRCDHCLVASLLSKTELKIALDLSKLLHGFYKVVAWVCQRCHKYLFKLLNLFVKLLHAYLASDKQNQAEV